MTLEAAMGWTNESSVSVGNVWKFTEMNLALKPSQYPREIQTLSQMGPELHNFILQMQQRFVRKDWYFRDLLIKDNLSIALVFNNPENTELLLENPSTALFLNSQIKGESGLETPYLPGDEVDKLLAGTNLTVYNAPVSYNAVERTETVGFIKKRQQSAIYFQAGVAYISLNMGNIQNRVASVDDDIQIIKSEANEKLKQKYRERKKFSDQVVASPVKLFG